MSQSKWIGKALSLALCTAAVSACSQGATSSNQSDASASADTSGITLGQKDEQQIRDAIAGAPAHGLKPELFLKGGESGPALVSAAVKYASALANGYSDPTKLHEVYTIPRAKTDVRAGLKQALQQGNVGDWLNSLAPQTDEYKALSQAFLRYIKLAEQPNQQPIASDKPIKPGARDPRIPAVVAVLRSGGYVPEQQQGTADPVSYTPALVAAVKQYQADYGTKPDGVLGKETIGALNAGPGYRARQLAVAMERLRWLQRDPPKTRIDVNTAAILPRLLARRTACRPPQGNQWRGGQANAATPGSDRPPGCQPGLAGSRRYCRQGARNQEPRLACGQRLRPERRQVDPAVRAEELAWPGQVRHAGRRGDLPSRHARQSRIRTFGPSSQPWLRAGRKCRAVRDGACPAGRHFGQIPAGDGEGRRGVHRAARRKSRFACSIRPPSGTGRGSSSAPTFTAGTRYRDGARTCSRPPQKIEQPESSDDIGP